MRTASTEREELARWQRSLLPGGLLAESGPHRSPRDWVVDVVLFLSAFALGGILLAATWQSHDGTTAIADIVLGAVACVSLWWRRRNPTGVGVLCAAISAVSALSGGAALAAVFNAAVRSTPRGLTTVVSTALAAGAVFAALYTGGTGFDWVGLVVGVLLTVVVVGWGLFARARRILVVSLRERADRLEAEQRARAEQAREAERRRIAREMHDVLAHRLSLLSVHAGALEFHADAPPGEVAEAAGVIRASAHAALQELRAVIGVLREGGDGAAPEPPQPTLGQIPALVDECRAAGMRVHCTIGVPDAAALPAGLGRTAYRIVQEGLTNARKHAPAAAVEVEIAGAPGGPLTVEVVSRRPVAAGVGARSAVPGAGSGLIGLSERVALAGGELVHGARADGDHVLRAELPWAA
jgi:signal transduction histidine kinase